MNNKKKMVLGAAFVVAIMALAGIGYAAAASSYQGTTDSETAEVSVNYVKIKLGNNGYLPPETLNITFDTETSPVISAGAVTGTTTTYTNPQSDILTYLITVEGEVDDVDTPVTLTASVASAFSETGFKLQVKYGDGGWLNFTGTTLELSTAKATILADGGTQFQVQVIQDGELPAGGPPATITIPAITFTVEVTNVTA